jgi:hypothetical protein
MFVLVMVIVSLHTFWYLSMRVQKQDGGRRGKDGKSDVPCCRTPVPMVHSLLGVSVSSMDWFAIGVQAAWVRLLRCSSPLCRSWCSLEQGSAFQLGIPNTLHRAQDPGMLALFYLWWELRISRLSSLPSSHCDAKYGTKSSLVSGLQS